MSSPAESGPGRRPYEGRSPEIEVRGWRRVALVTGVISFVSLLLMASSFVTRPGLDPEDETRALSSPELRALKARLAEDAGNEELKGRIRELDLAVRQEFFEARALTQRLAYLLLGAIVLFLVAVRRSGLTPHAPPEEPPPVEAPDEDGREAVLTRRALAGLGVVLGVSGLLWALLTDATLPTDAVEGAAAFPTLEEQRQNWPRFRGADANGTALSGDAPATWNGEDGTHILWKTPIPRPGFSSPVVWGRRVYLSGADAKSREVYAFDTASGQLLWTSPLVAAGQSLEIPEVGDDTGLAAPTLATDGRRIYALFATGEVAGFDLDGTQLWGASVGPFENAYGHASSLVVHEDRLLLQLDQGLEDDGLSRLLALDVLTGETVWEVARPVDASWSTPLVIPGEGGAAEVVLSATPWVISYDAREGTELWRARFLEGEVVPAPVSGEGLVFVLHQDVGGAAIRLGGRGDVTDSHVAWTLDYGAPSISSPVLSGGLLFIQEDDGLVSCYQAGDGAQLWEHELDGMFNASPVLVGERLYLTNTQGTTFTLKAGREVEELGRSELGEGVHASFGFAEGRLFIRGEEHLYAIGAPGP